MGDLGGDGVTAVGSQTNWANVTTSVLLAELRARQDAPSDRPIDNAPLSKPACGSGGTGAVYDTKVHVFALVLVLVLSTSACSFPIFVRHFPRIPIPHQFLFLCRYFGTGVLIATSFVHLLPTAFESLLDPCLPRFWNETYPAMPGLIVMCAVFMVVSVEAFFQGRGVEHDCGEDWTKIAANTAAGNDGYGNIRMNGNRQNGKIRRASTRTEEEGRSWNGDAHRENFPLQARSSFSPRASGEQIAWREEATTNGHVLSSHPSYSPSDGNEPKNLSSASDSDSDLDMDIEDLDPILPTSTNSRRRASSRQVPSTHHSHDHGADHTVSSQTNGSATLQVFLLEAGILFHSVFIGLTLSLTPLPPLLPLLIAISFHQTFEGLALGSRIAALPPPSLPLTLTIPFTSRFRWKNFAAAINHENKTITLPSTLAPAQPWLMALAFGTTTPLGQAIGILLGMRGDYDPKGKTGLLMVGIANAVSSGLLIWAGLVELLAKDFLWEGGKELRAQGSRKWWQAVGAVGAGAMGMAVVGAWA
ncbi:hypothetical protein MMC25_007450 [Agyrium rufum]|nr:hypothetical protein [Agyrium rufum]